MNNKMKQKTLGILVCMLLFATTLSVTGTINNNEDGVNPNPARDEVDWWPMFHHDSQHTGFSTSTAPSRFLNWSTHLGDPVTSDTPAVVDGFIYFGTSKGIVCRNASDGSLGWNYNVGTYVYSSPAVANGNVFIGAHTDYLYCINAYNGTLNWKYKTGDRIVSSPIVADGYVYFGSHDNNLYCMDADPSDGIDEGFDDPTGVEYDVIWKFEGNSAFEFSPAVAYGYVYALTGFSRYCLPQNDPNGDGIINNSEVIWEYITSGVLATSSPTVADGYVYFGATDDNVSCLNAYNGSFEWSFGTGNNVESSPAVAYGKVYVGSRDHYVYCLNATNGNLIWGFLTGADVFSSPAIADDKVYIGSNDKKLYCLNATDGSLIWRYPFFTNALRSPAIADGFLYITPISGRYAYRFGGEVNLPPLKPETPDGPIEGEADELYTYTTSTTDPEGCKISYNFSWGDGTYSGWTDFVDSGYSGSASHEWDEGGIYNVSVKAKDYFDAESEWADNLTIIIQVPPERPDAPDGPTEGVVDVEYTFTANTTDLNGDNISYRFSWSDGTYSNWTDFVPSGVEVSASHSWSEEKTYFVKVKAKDETGLESTWSLSLKIEITSPNKLTIESITGGIGVAAVIKNVGDVDVTDVNWTIAIDGGLFVKPIGDDSGTIDIIAAGDTVEITMLLFGVGLGMVTDMPEITVTAECAEGSSVEESITARIIFIFVMLQ